MLLFLNAIYVLIAIAMIALILMQRGAGAQAGSGFGGGASGTVFGSRGASSFLTKATKWLAIAFFAISLFMAWQATRSLRGGPEPVQDLGVMSQVPGVPVQAPGDTVVPAAPTQADPALPGSRAPAPARDSMTPAVPIPADGVPQAVTPDTVPPAATLPDAARPDASPQEAPGG